MHNVVSGDVDFDSFGMAPWDAGGMHGDHCQLREALRTMMLQCLMRLLCRSVIDRTMTRNTENGLEFAMPENVSTGRDGNYGYEPTRLWAL